MTIHKEGTTSILIVLCLVIGLSIVTYFYVPNTDIAYFLYFVFTAFFLFIISFFRYPIRKVKLDEHNIIAPADGKVVVVEKIFEEEYFKSRCKQISIFMSPLNVHSNHYPISGEVIYSQYHPGKHMVASHPKSSTLNERHSVVIKHKSGKKVLVKQVAGTVARRIVCYSKNGDKARQGDNHGFIKFGSRVDIIVPIDTEIMVNLEDKTVNRETVIAKFT